MGTESEGDPSVYVFSLMSVLLFKCQPSSMPVLTKFTLSLQNIDCSYMKAVKQDYRLFFPLVQIFMISLKLFVRCRCYIAIICKKSCWYFTTCISRLFLKDPPCLDLENKDKKTVTLVIGSNQQPSSSLTLASMFLLPS